MPGYECTTRQRTTDRGPLPPPRLPMEPICRKKGRQTPVWRRGNMQGRIRHHRSRGTKLVLAAALLGAIAAASVLVAAGAAGAASQRAAATPLLPASVHPPTFDDSKLFGLRNALAAALKGKSVSGVNTWMVVNILATYWVAGKQGD